MVQPPPVAAQYNVLMERMEADFFRAGLHRYMYLDPVVCCPLSHQEILGKKNWDYYYYFDLLTATQFCIIHSLCWISEEDKSFGSLWAGFPWLWPHYQKICLPQWFFSSQPSTQANRRNQLHCLKELHLAKLSRTACCLFAACSQKLFLQTFSTLAGPEWTFLIFGHGLGTSSSVSIWNWIWSFWFANGLLFSPAP